MCSGRIAKVRMNGVAYNYVKTVSFPVTHYSSLVTVFGRWAKDASSVRLRSEVKAMPQVTLNLSIEEIKALIRQLPAQELQ